MSSLSELGLSLGTFGKVVMIIRLARVELHLGCFFQLCILGIFYDCVMIPVHIVIVIADGITFLLILAQLLLFRRVFRHC